MRLDIQEGFGASYPDAQAVQQAIRVIARQTQDRQAQLLWSNHLRFLTTVQPRPDGYDPSRSSASGIEDSTEISDDEEYCSCTQSNSALFSGDEQRLRLTGPYEFPECQHYVAVSYCWSSTAKAPYAGLDFEIVQNGRDPRASKCPASLLDRVIKFARSKAVRFVWIDQECVDQDSDLDKEVGIQAMDLVYEQAVDCVAVLEASIMEQLQLDALVLLLDYQPELIDEKIIYACIKAVNVIVEDPWFSRAWCLQEATSGCQQMTLLIRCHPDLDVPEFISSQVEGCFELELNWLHGMMLGPLQASLESNVTSEAIKVEGRRLLDLWFRTLPPDGDAEVREDVRSTCNATEALWILERKANSVVADRLAIMGNLCRYDIRLNAVALDLLGFNFSICALVLSILNGDSSIVVSTHYRPTTLTNGEWSQQGPLPGQHAAALRANTLSWCPDMKSTLSSMSYANDHTVTLRHNIDADSLARGEGLRVEGCLWVVDAVLDISTVYSPQDLGRDSSEATLLIDILCAAAERKYVQVVDTIWNHFRLPGTESQRKGNPEVEKYCAASFEEIIDISSRTIKWPSPFWMLSPRALRVECHHPFRRLESDTVLGMIKKWVTHGHGRIPVGRPNRASEDPSSYSAIFDLPHPFELGSFVMSPRSNGELQNVEGYGVYPSNWLVSDPSTAAPEIFATCVRPVGGLWRCQESDAAWITLR